MEQKYFLNVEPSCLNKNITLSFPDTLTFTDPTACKLTFNLISDMVELIYKNEPNIGLKSGDIEKESVSSCQSFEMVMTAITDKELEQVKPEMSEVIGLPHQKIKKVGKKILIVEDSLFNQEILQRVLKAENYECTIANNGEEALTYFKTEAFDLIFMDIEMPVMNGHEATRRIRERETELNLAPTPIICLSSNIDEESKQEALTAGMNAFIVKPFKKDDILQRMKELISENSEPILPRLEEKNPLKKKQSIEISLNKNFSYSSNSLSTFFHKELSQYQYAKHLIKKLIPTNMSLEKKERDFAIQTLANVLESKKIDTYLSPEIEKLIKNLLRDSLYLGWGRGSFFCCHNNHSLRKIPYKEKVAFTEEALTKILSSTPVSPHSVEYRHG